MKISQDADLANAHLTIEWAKSRQHRILEGYCFCLPRGELNVRGMIVKDIYSFFDLGARRHASDLTEVLKQFDIDHPSGLA